MLSAGGSQQQWAVEKGGNVSGGTLRGSGAEGEEDRSERRNGGSGAASRVQKPIPVAEYRAQQTRLSGRALEDGAGCVDLGVRSGVREVS